MDYLDTQTVILGAAGVLGLYAINNYLRGVKPVRLSCDLNNQSKEIKRPDGSLVRISRQCKDNKLVEHLHANAKTVFEIIRSGATETKDGRCLGVRSRLIDGKQPYKWIKYSDVISRSEAIAAGLMSLGIDNGQTTRIGIYSVNRPEWVIAEQATYVYNMVNVPLYDTLGQEAVSFILQQAKISVVFCDTAARAKSLVGIASQCPNLAVIIAFDGEPDELRSLAGNTGIRILRLDQVEADGRANQNKWPATPPKPEDSCTICYTSGTTGTPKGVELSHMNLVSQLSVFMQLQHTQFGPDDVLISYLPLAHMFERMMQQFTLHVGGRIGFSQGNVKLLNSDMQELKPTIFPVVPRLLNRLHDVFWQTANKTAATKVLADIAVNRKVAELERGVIRKDSIWDKLMFNKVQAQLGGRVKIVITGSAPIAVNVLQFVRAALGCVVIEAYGQTESGGCATATLEGDAETGHVGPPIPCSELKLVDVPEMNYYAKDRRGEICIRGKNVFKGYLNEPQKTAETLDKDGWLYTGDIGMYTERGCLKVIDRKKHIFKLAQGEYIAPEKIENIYTESPLVAQVFVYGNSLKASLVAIVVPDIHELRKQSILQGAPETLKTDKVRDIFVDSDPWTVDNGMLTPTFKSKRPFLEKHYQSTIDKMYEKLQ